MNINSSSAGSGLLFSPFALPLALGMMDLVDDYELSAHYLRVLQYAGVAATAMVVYDTVITIDNEVKHFWSASLSLVKVIYFLNRYYGLGVVLIYLYGETLQAFSDELCKHMVGLGAWCAWILVLLADAIMAIRVHALYGRTRNATLTLGSMYFMQGAATLGILLSYERKFQDDVLEAPRACGTITPSWLSVYWIPTSVFESILLCLTLHKSIKDGVFESASGIGRRHSLYHVLVQDQMIYFASILLSGVMNIALWHVLPEGVPNNQILTISVASLCVLGCRILVDLREVARKQEEYLHISSLGEELEFR